MFDGLAVVAVEASYTLSHSALPDAPVVPDPPARRHAGVARLQVARLLRRVAAALEPAPAHVPTPVHVPAPERAAAPGRVATAGC